jgi:hypothetical protein
MLQDMKSKTLLIVLILSLLWPRIAAAQIQDVYFYPLDLDTNGNPQGGGSLRASSNGLWAVWITQEPKPGNPNQFYNAIRRKDLSKPEDPAQIVNIGLNPDSYINLTQPDISNDGNTIAFTAQTNIGIRAYILKGSELTRIDTPQLGLIVAIALSGNANYLAIDVRQLTPTTPRQYVYLYDIVGQTVISINQTAAQVVSAGVGNPIDISDTGTVAIIATDLLTNTTDNTGTTSLYRFTPEDKVLKYALPITGTWNSTRNAHFIQLGVGISPNGRYMVFSSRHQSFSQTSVEQIVRYDNGFGDMLKITQEVDPQLYDANNPLVNDNGHVLYRQNQPANLESRYLRLYRNGEVTTLAGGYQIPSYTHPTTELGAYTFAGNNVIFTASPRPTPVIGGSIFLFTGEKLLHTVSSGYDFVTHPWSVQNFSYQGQNLQWSTFREIWGKDNVEQPGGAPKAAAMNYYIASTCQPSQNCKPIGYGGICGGMAIASSLAYINDIRPPLGNFPASFTWNQSPSPILTTILGYQWSQLTKEGQETFSTALTMSLGTTIDKVKSNISAKLANKQILAIRIKNPNTGKCAYHGILPFAYAENNNQLIIENYDPNHRTGLYKIDDLWIIEIPADSKGSQNLLLNKQTGIWRFDMTGGWGVQTNENNNTCVEDGRALPITIGMMNHYQLNEITLPWNESFITKIQDFLIRTDYYRHRRSLNVTPQVGDTDQQTMLFGSGIFTATATDQNATVQLFQPDGSDLEVKSSFTTQFVISDTAHFTATTFGQNQITQTDADGRTFMIDGDITGKIIANGNATSIEVGTPTKVELQTYNGQGAFSVNIEAVVGNAYVVEANTSSLAITIGTDVGSDGSIDQTNTYSPSPEPTPTFTATPTPSQTPTMTVTVTPTIPVDPSPTSTVTPTSSATATPIVTIIPTATTPPSSGNELFLPLVTR